MFFFFFLDRYGRKTAILLSGIIFTIGAVVMGAAPSKEVLLVGRVIIGIAVGMSSPFLIDCCNWMGLFFTSKITNTL